MDKKIKKAESLMAMYTHGILEKKGITLIALVVTIVVLLILAGVSINLLLGKNGIITRATGTKGSYEKSAIKEELELAIGDIQIDEMTKGNNLTLDSLTGYGGILSTKISIDSWKSANSGTYKGKKFIINDDFSVSIDEENYNYTSVMAMKLDYQNLVDGQVITTKAYYENANEAGGGTYKITLNDGSFTDDGGKFIKLDDNSDLWAVLQIANDEIDVYQYGAYGDGIKDDSEYIKKAIKSNIKTIHIATGTYIVSSEITIPSNITIVGDNNSTILACEGFKSGANVFVASNKENITIKNITISGNSAVNTRDKGYSDQDGIHLLDLWGNNNVLIENCTFKDNIYAAIRIFKGDSIEIGKSKFYNVDCGVISLGNEGIDNLKIINNVFDGHEYSEPISLFTNNANYTNVTISGNKMSNKINGIGINLRSGNQFEDVIVSNNVIENCAAGLVINNVTGNSIISNNTINTVNNGVGFRNCEDVIVKDLSVDNTKLDGLKLSNCKNMDISNIKISRFGMDNKDFMGIKLLENGSGTTLSGKIEFNNESLATKAIGVYGNNYNISGMKFDIGNNKYFGIQFFSDASGNVFHTNDYVPIAYEAQNIKNDIVVNTEIEFTQGINLSNYAGRFCTNYIVNRKANTEYALSNMFACQEGFERKITIKADVDTKLESKNSTGGIVWNKDRTIRAGNSETIYLVCQNGIWKEIQKN